MKGGITNAIHSRSRFNVLLKCLFLSLLLSACSFRSCSFSYVIDEGVKPSQPYLEGLDGGRARVLAVIVGPSGSRNEFVADEVVFHPKDSGELNAFLAKYGGTVLRDGTPVMIEGLLKPKTIPSSGWYLIRVDLKRSSVDDIAANMKRIGVTGRYVFSSSDSARLAALVAREDPKKVGPNLLMYAHDVVIERNILEHPDGLGGFIDAAAFPWMTDVFGPPAGLGIGVVRAWNYLRYKGIPPAQGNWSPPIVAIVDNGFIHLHPTTGLPISGNIDYVMGNRPLQMNLVNTGTNSAGGPNTDPCFNCTAPPFHGQQVFGAAAAFPRNRFGSAGSGGDVVRPMLIRTNTTTSQVGDAIRGAALNGASVINLSFGFSALGELGGWFYSSLAQLQENINFARAWGKPLGREPIIVASAGNNNEQDNNRLDNVPCTLDGVICVGAIMFNTAAENNVAGGNVSGSGKRVAIWAPDCIRTTPDPSRMFNPMMPRGLLDLPIACGTSIAAPFVAGIVGLMKALKPSLSYSDVVAILQKTARRSTDPKVTPGYVDALAALEEISPNQPPTIKITAPKQGGSVACGTQVQLTSAVTDPEQAPRVDLVVVQWKSDKDGDLCTGITCDAKKLRFGPHTITATVADPFGATASDSIKLKATGKPPSVTITHPPNGSTFFESQLINLRGFGSGTCDKIPNPNLAWSSDGKPLLKGHDVWLTLSKGTHVITLEATDLGQTAQNSITITVQAGTDVPTAKILSPQDGLDLGVNQRVALLGEGIDWDLKPLPGPSLEWFSDRDGALGKGNNILVTLSGQQCLIRNHKITLRVTNNAKKQAEHSITVTVGSIC